MRKLFPFALLLVASPVFAQDIRGLEVCTAEKQMERRTSCLQANTEFLQQALAKHTRETKSALTTASRDLNAAQAEIAALKTHLAGLERELAQLRAKTEVKPDGKK
jgi:septal ring factor EnvC (AmiA/AmiB activator)